MTDIKNYTTEQIQVAEKILSDRKSIENPLCTYFVTLGQSSGSKDVRFVLYRLQHKVMSAYVNPFTFNSILCDDVIEACEKAINRCGSNPIVLDFDCQRLKAENMKPNFLPFGKYKDMHVEDVLQSDPQYIFWLANNYNGKNLGLATRLSEIRETAKESIININKEKYTSKFIGEVDQKISVCGTINSVYVDDYDRTVLKFQDEEGNLFIKKGNVGEFIKGDSIYIEGKVKNHYESMGIKYTNFGGRCKIIKK